MEFVEFELRNYTSYCQPPSVVIELFTEIVVKYELKADKDLKAFTSIAIFKYDHFPKPEILFRSYEYLKLLGRNHYKNISRMEFEETSMHIIQLSHVLQGEVVRVFFFCLFFLTHADGLVAEFSVLELLYSI